MKIVAIIMAATFVLFPTISQAADVYVLRGLFGFLFPSVMYPLAEDLENDGHRVMMTDWHQNSQKKIIEDAVRRHKETGKKVKVVLIGHSLGGNAVTALTEDFQKHGIDIDYLAVIDAPVPNKVKNSALVVDNFYQFNDWRNPIIQVESTHAVTDHGYHVKIKFEQFNFRGKRGLNGGPGKLLQKEDHFGVATNSFTISRIKEQIDALK